MTSSTLREIINILDSEEISDREKSGNIRSCMKFSYSIVIVAQHYSGIFDCIQLEIVRTFWVDFYAIGDFFKSAT